MNLKTIDQMESNLQSTMAQLLAEARKTSQTAITTPRFRIDLSRDEVFEMLKGFYINDVQDRNSGSFQDDEDTNKRLRMISGWLTSGKNRPSLLLYGGVGNGNCAFREKRQYEHRSVIGDWASCCRRDWSRLLF